MFSGVRIVGIWTVFQECHNRTEQTEYLLTCLTNLIFKP